MNFWAAVGHLPTEDEHWQLHGNRAYLVVSSLLGVAAFVGGLLTLISGSLCGYEVIEQARAKALHFRGI